MNVLKTTGLWLGSLCYFPLLTATAQVPGTLDPGFNAPANLGTVLAIGWQRDGKIVVGGGDPSFGRPPLTFVRLNPDGSLDPGFQKGAGPNGFVEKVVILPSGQILIAGNFSQYNSIPRSGLARLNSDGSLDDSFHPDIQPGNVHRIAVKPDGKILIAGGFSTISGTARTAI